MAWKYEKRYAIKQISEDGLLKDPKGRWGDCAFYSTYESEAEAIRAIHEDDDFDDLIILTVMSKQFYLDSDNG